MILWMHSFIFPYTSRFISILCGTLLFVLFIHLFIYFFDTVQLHLDYIFSSKIWWISKIGTTEPEHYREFRRVLILSLNCPVLVELGRCHWSGRKSFFSTEKTINLLLDSRILLCFFFFLLLLIWSFQLYLMYTVQALQKSSFSTDRPICIVIYV